MCATTSGHIDVQPDKNVETLFSFGKHDFTCLTTCDGKIPVLLIKDLIDFTMFKKMIDRAQEAEIKNANIPGTSYCSFCEYAVILPDGNNIISCIKCGKETCRLCNKESHIPRKCGESPDEDLKKWERIKYEEYQTGQIKRQCPKCKKAYIKISGCNVVQCPCGEQMCYICGYQLTNFNGDPHNHRCPLAHNSQIL